MQSTNHRGSGMAAIPKIIDPLLHIWQSRSLPVPDLDEISPIWGKIWMIPSG